MITWNVHAAWIGILLGGVAGAVQGLFIRDESWLGGYGSWPRRMLRLGHISLFGIAFINLAFAFTVSTLAIEGGIVWPSILLVIGMATMPPVCYLSAVRDRARHLFFIPVLSVVAGSGLFLWRLVFE